MKNNFMKFGGRTMVPVLLAAVTTFMHAEQEDFTSRINGSNVLGERLTWVGNKPDSKQSEALWKALNIGTNGVVFEELESFVSDQADSSWTPSVRHVLAQKYRQQGRYSAALTHWEKAWSPARDISGPEGGKLKASIVADWAELLSVLGRTADLKALLLGNQMNDSADAESRRRIATAMESLMMMERHPGLAYRCGTFALAEVGRSLRPGDGSIDALIHVSSPSIGFSMRELVELSDRFNLGLVAVDRGNDSDVVVPSVVHWRLDHYAAIIDRKDDFYRVVDPTFGEPRWMHVSILNSEASGHFLIPAAEKPTEWVLMSDRKAGEVFGKGYYSTVKDGKDEGCKKSLGGAGDENCAPCKEAKGMPIWWISEPYINLWMADEPVFYTTTLGENISFRLQFKQRDTRPGSTDPAVAITGWNHNWSSYITVTDQTYIAGGGLPAANFDEWIATVYLPGGGERTYSYANRLDEGSRTRLEPMRLGTQVPVTGSNVQAGFRLIHPDGSQSLYAEMQASSQEPNKAVALLTSQIDASGRTNRIVWDAHSITGTRRVRHMIDYDGKTNNLSYTTGNLLSKVETPYGRQAEFKYDAAGNLTNIVDAIGITSSISYDSSGWPTKLVTPYGTNEFIYHSNTNYSGYDPVSNNYGGHGVVNRAITVREPNGGSQLYLYLFDGAGVVTNGYSSDEFPTNTPYGTIDDGRGASMYRELLFRNSFHWNQKQYSWLSTETVTNLTFGDYLKGHQKHWLADSNNLQISGTISMEREPSLDGINEGQKIWYDYPGKSANGVFLEGPDSLPSVVARVLPNGETQYSWRRYNRDGFLTNSVSTYTTSTGAVGTRTNVYVYGENKATYVWRNSGSTFLTTYSTNFNLLLFETSWNGQCVASYGAFDIQTGHATNAPATLSVTTTNFFVQPKYWTNGLGEVAEFIYGPRRRHETTKMFSGLTTSNVYDGAAGPLTTVVQLEINRTNRFSYYTNNLIQHWTNELGLKRTVTWDALERVTGVSFPDTSTVSNRYSNLDLIEVKSREGQWRSFGYNSMRQLTAFTNALTGVTRYGYCGCGSLESVTNALNQITTLFHDNQLRLTTVLFPDTSTTTYNYDLAGRLTNTVDTSGAQVTNWFNNQGLLVLSSNSIGRIRSVVYDKLDRAIQTIGGNGVLVTNSFDSLDRLLTRTYPDGGVEKFAYSTNGLVSYTNQLGHISRFVNDAAYRTLSVTDANTEVVQLKYDPASNLTNLVDARTKSTSWKFDEYGRLVEKRDHSGVTNFVYRYNRNGWLTNRWTPGKTNVVYSYDLVGNVTNVDYAASADLRFQYDALSRVTNMVTVGQFTNRFGYTSFGAIASEDGSWESDTITYSYTDQLLTGISLLQPSASAWVQNYEYDAADRLKTISGSAGNFIYDYDSVRKWLVNKIALPNTSYITNTFDSVARLNGTWLKNSAKANLNYHTYGINTGGQRTSQERMGGNYVDYTYDPIGQLKTALGKEANTAPRLQEQFGYKYDAAGNLSHRTNNALVQTFNANDLNELTTATRAGALTVAGATTSTATNVAVNTVYKADLYSDFTFASTNTFALVNGDNTFSATATDAQGRTSSKSVTFNLPATVDFDYDANGNLTNDGNRVLEFDDENQLTRITVLTNWKAEFAYDGFMRRVLRKDYRWIAGTWLKTNEVRYVFNGMLAVQERDTNNAPRVTYTRGLDLSGDYQGAGGIGGLLARTDHTAGKTGFYHADGNGNITALVNQQEVVSARYVYDPFGNTLAASGPLAQANTMRFSSKEIHAPSGLYYYGYRFYDPNLQRWINRDPIGEAGGINLYGFVYNDPNSFIDPDGEAIHRVVAGAGYALGGILFDEVIDRHVMPHVDDAIDKHFDKKSAQTLKNMKDALDKARALKNPKKAVKELKDYLGKKKKKCTTPQQRGRDNEEKVLDDMGKEKNTETFETSHGDTIPDFVDSRQIGDIKDTKRIHDSSQMKAQREVAEKSGKEHVVVTGQNTKVSKPLAEKSTVIRRPDLGPQ